METMVNLTHHDFIKCPFCSNHNIENKTGKTSCPDCSTVFEIDDRGECIFVDTNNPRLPVNGTICTKCGLIQNEDNEKCLYCGVELYNKSQ